MSARSHARHVVDQFGAQASAYVTSAVHAAGADLDRIGVLMRAAGCPGPRPRLRRRPCRLHGRRRRRRRHGLRSFG